MAEKFNWQRRTFSRLLLLGCLGIALALGGGQIFPSIPVRAQALRPEEVSAAVYEQLQYLPKENGYQRLETGAVDTEFTLVNRLIRYHQDLKKRSPRFRLDWKLTLADYLGANEPMEASRYPGSGTLDANPMARDREAIARLNRRQRAELVDLLASLYSPAPAPLPQPSTPPVTPQPPPEAGPRQPALSQPGDAQLLLP